MKLGIDLETFSPENLKLSGLYRYALNPEFDILLFGYSLDGEAPVVLDCTKTNDRLELMELAPLIYNAGCIKTAYNAAFEWYCLSVYLNRYKKLNGLLPIDQWRDTQLAAQYCGYPTSLEDVGRAMQLPEDKKKLATGKTLIRLFCSPRKPTKRDQRTRIYPEDEPEKWELFKTYNAGDVISEQEIARRLEKWPVPDFVQKQWELDTLHNAMGVNIDMKLVNGAISIADRNTKNLLDEAAEITGLDNPNSRDQLKDWLTKELPEDDVPDMKKDTVSGLLKNVSAEHVKRVLEIRQETGKAAHKKYTRIKSMVCADGRVRGMMKFYGAGRTGRWCLTGDHEVLTPTGWVRLDQWAGGQIITWNPDQETFAFNKCEALQFDYTGDLIHLKSQRFDQVSTPDHKMAVLGKNGLWEPNSIGSIVKSGKRVTLPFTGYREKRSAFSPWELRVLIMTQADGYYTLKGGLRYHFAKKRKVERCKTLLRMCGIPFTMLTYADQRVTINVRQVDMPLWLRSFRDKTFGMWLIDEDATVILDEIVEWDGYRCGPNSYQYSTTNRKNAEIIQLCAVLSGRTATVLTKKRTNSNWNTTYVVNIWNTPGRGSIVNPCNFSTEYMDNGKVYCAKTSTGYFLVRRNGVVWVTGNSSTGVQLQNLARTHVQELDFARGIVEAGDLDALKFCYGAVSDTLGQLVRTALIPSPGHVFVDADFSAIEARVIAWLAGEEWVLEVFRTHGKIYEATASQMFGVPMEKIKKGNPEYELRQRGKVATLACIAEDSLVPVKFKDGSIYEIPIQLVTSECKVWDGNEWVSCDGAVFNGYREVITYEGLTATPDHFVWVEGQDEPVPFWIAAQSGSHLAKSGTGRFPVWMGKNHKPRTSVHQGMVGSLRSDGVSELRAEIMDVFTESYQRKIERVPSMFSAPADTEMAGSENNCGETALPESKRSRLFRLRRPWYRISVFFSSRVRALHHVFVPESGQELGDRQNRQQWSLRTGEHKNGSQEEKHWKQTNYCSLRLGPAVLAVLRNLHKTKAIRGHDTGTSDRRSTKSCTGQAQELARNTKTVRVYDIRNAGPNHRYAVQGVIVHNCGYQGGAHAMATMDINHAIDPELYPSLVKKWRQANPAIVKYWYDTENAALETLRTGQPHKVRYCTYAFETDEATGQWFLTCLLPSGRKLFYVRPTICENRFGKQAIRFWGVNDKKKWGEIDTYGGRLVENCISGESLVLTQRGLVRLKNVCDSDMLWDGIEYVRHKGLLQKGKQYCICVNGVYMTPDHKILTEGGWVCASSCEGHNGPAKRVFNSDSLCRERREKVAVDSSMRLRNRKDNARKRVYEEENQVVRLHDTVLHIQESNNARNERKPVLERLALHAAALRVSVRASLEKLRGPWNNGMPGVGRLREFLQRHVRFIQARPYDRKNRREQGILQGELQMDTHALAGPKQAQQSRHRYASGKNDDRRSIGTIGDRPLDPGVPCDSQLADSFAIYSGGYTKQSVYDIMECGPRNRFTVMGENGLMIVHNCCQAVARDCLAEKLYPLERAGYPVVFSIHDEIIADVPESYADLKTVTDIMSAPISWAPGLPLNAEGWVGKYFKKD